MIYKTAAIFLVLTPVLLADGGAIQSRQEAGPFVVTVFASAAPLRAGPADISVLVQNRETLSPDVDALVSVRLQHRDSDVTAAATREQARNKLLRAALVNLADAGEWRYTVTVSRGQALVNVSGSLTVVAAEPKLASYWTYLAFPPVCIVLFAIHQRLKRKMALARAG